MCRRSMWMWALPAVLACWTSVSCSDRNGGPVVVEMVDHPMSGHWMGTIDMDGGRQANICIQVEAAEKQPRVALTHIAAGAHYTDCTVLAVSDAALSFRFDRGKYDNVYDATLSEDGALMTGTITVPEGSSSAMTGGTFRLERLPRAPFVPGAMVFSKGMTGAVGDFTLTITLAQTDEGRWVAEIDIPEQNLRELPLFNVTEENGVVTGSIQIFGPRMVFAMMLSEDRQRLTGEWRSSGPPTPLDLPRVR